MNTAVQPSRRLFDADKTTRLDYVPSAKTDLKAKWASFFAEHAKPDTADSYQADQIAEHAARQIPGQR
jgi:hypothetical protein